MGNFSFPFNLTMELSKLYPSSGGGNGGGGGTGSGFQPKDIQNTDFLCEANSAYPIDTSSNSVIGTLPPTVFLNNGDRVQFFDGIGSSDFFNPTGFGNNSLFIAPNTGQTILGYDDLFEIHHDNETITLTYYAGRWSVSGGVRSQPAYTYTPQHIEYVLSKIMELQN